MNLEPDYCYHLGDNKGTEASSQCECSIVSHGQLTIIGHPAQQVQLIRHPNHLQLTSLLADARIDFSTQFCAITNHKFCIKNFITEFRIFSVFSSI